MEVKFCEYLINIGLINKETFSTLILEYHKKHTNENNFMDNMTLILNNFIENLTKEEKNYMSSNLIKYYLQFIKNKKYCRLKALYMLYKGKTSLIKLKYLYKWKYLSVNNQINPKNGIINIISTKKSKKRKYRNEPNELYKFKNNFLSMKINNNNKYIDKFQIMFNNDKKKQHQHPISQQNESSIKKFDSTKDSIKKNGKKNLSELKTSLALKEEKEFEECTFSPKINYTSRGKSPKRIDIDIDENNLSTINNKSNYKKKYFEIFNKLYNDNIIYKNKIKTSQEKYDKKFKEENTFRPKIFNNSFTQKYIQEHKSFTERQKHFLEKKEKKTEKIKKLLEEKYSKLYSFAPDISISLKSIKNNGGVLKEYYTNQPENMTKSNKCFSPFLRLYEDSKNRNIRQIQRKQDNDNHIIDMANISCKKDNNIVDYDKLNQLYLYKKKKEIMKKTKKKVEEEEGSTFKPNIYINECAKNINSDFFERNEKFLKDKKNFIELSIKEQNKNFSKDKFTKEEKKEIVKNIVKRLTNEKKIEIDKK